MAVCPNCDGRRVVECFSCNGGYEIAQFQNSRPCPSCGGKRTHYTQTDFCFACNGSGVVFDKVPCHLCHGSRMHQCLRCFGAGSI
jgi:DnaJ-class molecular chaperone